MGARANAVSVLVLRVQDRHSAVVQLSLHCIICIARVIAVYQVLVVDLQDH